jgi:hypothetical protein
VSDLTPLAERFEKPPAAPETFNVLAYGRPGSGKSTAAATMPGPILWINAEGAGALSNARKVAADRGTRIDELRVDRTPDVRGLLNEVWQYVDKATGDAAPRTVVIDTVGELRELLIKQLVKQGSTNSLQQYGQVATTLREFLIRLRNRDSVNLVILAHAEIDGDDGAREIRPQVGGKLTEQVPGWCDVVTYCGVERTKDEIRYMGLLVETAGRTAKDRSASLGDTRPLDLGEWLSVYRDGLTPAAPDDSDLPFTDGEGEDDAVVQPELAS